METQAFGSEVQNMQDSFLAATAPLKEVWRQTWIEWPVSIASESLRFAAHRLRAHGDFYSKLQTCASMPEMFEAHSSFMRSTLDDYGTEAGKVIKESPWRPPVMRD